MPKGKRPLIVHLRAANFVGGPEKQILEHLSRMKDSPFHTVLCTYDEAGGPSPLHNAGMALGHECHRLSARSPFDPRGVLELAGLLSRLGANLLVTHGYKPNILGRLASWKCGIMTKAVSRGWTYETARIRIFESLDRLFLRFADQVIAVSHGQREKIIKAGVSQDKVEVIHNSINLEEVPGQDASMPERRRLGIPLDAVLVGSAGRLSPEKNHLGLIEAAAKIAQDRDDIHFIIWGEGFLRRQLEQSIRDLGLSGRFHLPGFSQDARRHFHELDIFVLPSHTEGLSNVILEASACSKPVIATAVGGNPEVVEDGSTGILTPAGDTNAMSRAILSLATSPELRTTMGRAGRMRVQEKFDFVTQTKRYVSLYEEMLSCRRIMA